MTDRSGTLRLFSDAECGGLSRVLSKKGLLFFAMVPRITMVFLLFYASY